MDVDGSVRGILRSVVGDSLFSELPEPVSSYLVGLVASYCENGDMEEGDVIDCVWPFLEDTHAVDAEEARKIASDCLRGVTAEGLVAAREEEVQRLENPVYMEKLAISSIGAGTAFMDVATGGGNSNAQILRGQAAESEQRKKLSTRSKKKEDAAQNEAYMRYVKERENLRQRIMSRMIVSRIARPAVKDVRLDRFDVHVGFRKLLTDASVSLVFGRRYGLVGKNGIGKTTLLRQLCDGEIEGIPEGLQILHIEQEVVGDDRTVLETVLETDFERAELLKKEKSLIASGKDDGLKQVYDRLAEIGADAAEARAGEILSGLGFTPEMQGKPTKEFSGGWRMRVAISQALFIHPDILLLDEPTNHLDLHALLWLEDYLQQWDNTLIVVSHARAFLDVVCTDIIHLANGVLEQYRGDYTNFEKARRIKMESQQRVRDAQLRHREHIASFVERFRYKTKTARLAQSRLKVLEKMEIIPELIEDPSFEFHFPPVERLSSPILQMIDASFWYEETKPIFQELSLSVNLDSRIALVGPNGSGKTTLLNVIYQSLEPTEGIVVSNAKLRIGRFSQHHVDNLEMQYSPVENLMSLYPNSTTPEVRAHLAALGIGGDLALQPTYTLSGGQKSRVVFALITFSKPHILLLDEPTNHLDTVACEALIQAINEFEGGVIVVSHDEHFITSVCDDIWVVENGVNRFPGDFQDYKNELRKRFSL